MVFPSKDSVLHTRHFCFYLLRSKRFSFAVTFYSHAVHYICSEVLQANLLSEQVLHMWFVLLKLEVVYGWLTNVHDKWIRQIAYYNNGEGWKSVCSSDVRISTHFISIKL